MGFTSYKIHGNDERQEISNFQPFVDVGKVLLIRCKVGIAGQSSNAKLE